MDVIFYEWVDHRGRGVLSSHALEQDQLAKLDQLLDRIEELDRLDYKSTQGLIAPFDHQLKKLKIRGRVALRPILVLGPFQKDREVTFLLMAEEKDRKLDPPKRRAVRLANERLKDILENRGRRRRYERD